MPVWNRRRMKGWDIFHQNDLTPKDKFLALKVIMRECNEAKSVLFKEGHSIMDEVIRRERERLWRIEAREINQ